MILIQISLLFHSSVADSGLNSGGGRGQKYKKYNNYSYEIYNEIG